MTLAERNKLKFGDIVTVDMKDHPFNRYTISPTPFGDRLPVSEMELKIVYFVPSSTKTMFRVFRYNEPVEFHVELEFIKNLIQ